MSPLRRRAFLGGLVLAATVAGLFVAIPLVALLVNVGPGRLLGALDDPATLDALRVSAEASAIALAVIIAIGTPAAWLLATRRFPGRTALVTLLELPLVLPPAVAGIALLAAFGSGGVLGDFLGSLGVDLPFTFAAVVVAEIFVAGPLYLRQAQVAFAALDPALVEAARTLGAGEARAFARVAVPAAAGGLGAGAALAWARAVGEFGATLILAGSLQGVTQTLPLAIYAGFGTNFPQALAQGAVLLVASAAVLLAVRGRRWRRDALA